MKLYKLRDGRIVNLEQVTHIVPAGQGMAAGNRIHLTSGQSIQVDDETVGHIRTYAKDGHP